MYRWTLWLSAFFLLIPGGILRTESLQSPVIALTVANHVLEAEVAYTEKTRTQGLMFRSSLEENAGMLFVFPSTAYYSMWMKNTMIPLSVAFINETGVILNIENMQPYSLTAHHSAGRVKYALEMNKGWFDHRNIKAGALVAGLERAPAAE